MFESRFFFRYYSGSTLMYSVRMNLKAFKILLHEEEAKLIPCIGFAFHKKFVQKKQVK